MQGSPLISLSAPTLVRMPGVLSWRLGLLSPLVATPLIPLVFSASLPSPCLRLGRELGGVTSFSFSSLSTPLN